MALEKLDRLKAIFVPTLFCSVQFWRKADYFETNLRIAGSDAMKAA